MNLTDTTAASLIPDVLVKVFWYLEASSKCYAAQVCRQWRDVAFLRSLWRNVLLTPGVLVMVFEYLDTRSKGRVARGCVGRGVILRT